MIPLLSFFFKYPSSFFLTLTVLKLPTCVKTEVFSGRERCSGTWKQHVFPSCSPALCSAHHKNSEFTATAHFSQTLPAAPPSCLLHYSIKSFQGTRVRVLLTDQQLHANTKGEQRDKCWLKSSVRSSLLLTVTVLSAVGLTYNDSERKRKKNHLTMLPSLMILWQGSTTAKTGLVHCVLTHLAKKKNTEWFLL